MKDEEKTRKNFNKHKHNVNMKSFNTFIERENHQQINQLKSIKSNYLNQFVG